MNLPRYSRWLQGGIFAFLLCTFLGSFIGSGMVWYGVLDPYVTNPEKLSVLKNYIFFAFGGAIGGTLYCLRLFYQHYIRGDLHIRKWWIWYIVRPVTSAGMAVMIIILFESGIMLLTIGDSLESKIGLSFLVGYGFGKMIDKVEGLTQTLFNGNPNDKPVK
jgi:hypothetical protein